MTKIWAVFMGITKDDLEGEPIKIFDSYQKAYNFVRKHFKEQIFNLDDNETYISTLADDNLRYGGIIIGNSFDIKVYDLE